VISRHARPLLLAAPLLLGGCTYAYDNPAEDLGTGEVAGRVVADAGGGGTLDGVADVRVELRNSFNVVTTRDSGRFFLFGMMPGRHTVLFSKAPDLALQRDVEMAYGADGQPEGVILGDLRLRRAVTLQGRVLAPTAAQLGGFSGFEGSLGTVVDEATGQEVQVALPPGSDGAFDFAFAGAPTGPHRLRTAVQGLLRVYDPVLGPPSEVIYGPATLVGGPIVVDVPDSSEGLKLDVNDTTPALPAPAASGKLRFRAAIAGASSALAFDVTVSQLPIGSAPPVVPTPDSTGAYELDLPPALYQVTVALPAGYTGPLLPPPGGQAVVVETQTSELGTFYAVDTAVFSASVKACLDGADCTSGTCQGGQCLLVACLPGDFTSDCALAASDCARGILTPCGNGQGSCAGAASAPACVPKGALACTGATGGTATVPVCKPN
jgi:hypothetical protein